MTFSGISPILLERVERSMRNIKAGVEVRQCVSSFDGLLEQLLDVANCCLSDVYRGNDGCLWVVGAGDLLRPVQTTAHVHLGNGRSRRSVKIGGGEAAWKLQAARELRPQRARTPPAHRAYKLDPDSPIEQPSQTRIPKIYERTLPLPHAVDSVQQPSR